MSGSAAHSPGPTMITNTVIYLFARSIPGVINLFAIAVYTRLLSPEEFGAYVLTIAVSGFLSSVLFQWLTMGVLRFLPGRGHERESIVSTALFGVVVIVAATALLGGFLYAILPPSLYRSALPACLLLFWLLGLFELAMQVVSSSLLPVKYGVLSAVKAAAGLAVGVLLVRDGYGAQGPLLGIMAGISLATLFVRREFTGVSVRKVDRARLAQFVAYGAPLTATFALSLIVSTSDRFLLSWYLGASAGGLYAAGYDLAQQSVGFLMSIVSLAAYPLVVQALERYGREEVRQRLQKYLTILLAVAIPSATGLALCAQNIGVVLLGEAFRDSAATIIPWVAFTTVLFGIKAYYLDLSFQLGQRTMGQVHVMLISAVLNLALNSVLIPVMGITGALVGSAAAYAAGFLLSLAYGRRVFALPAPTVDSARILLATGIMAAGLLPLVQLRGPTALAIQVLAGVVIYSGSCMLLDVLGMRGNLLRYVQNGMRPRPQRSAS